MKLSEAMMLGAAVTDLIEGDINRCALGAAGNAVGIKDCADNLEDSFRRWLDIAYKWPWLMEKVKGEMRFAPTTYNWDIAVRFDHDVCDGVITFEQLVDYVRSIEPECGECNRFECTCRPAAVPEAESEKVTA